MTARFSAKQKNQDNMDLLLSDTELQKAVAKIREDFDIPPGSFKKDGPRAEAWLGRLVGASGKGKLFAKVFRGLIDDFSVPENYGEYLKRYVLYDTTDAPLNNFAIVPFSRTENPSGPRHLSVQVYAHLTKEEHADLRKELDRMGKELPEPFGPLKDLGDRLAREKLVREAQEFNTRRNEGDARVSFSEVLGTGKGARKVPEKASEDTYELNKLRNKRFRKK